MPTILEQSETPIYKRDVGQGNYHGSPFQGALASAHFGIAAIVFVIYGIQVCPLLESLTPSHLAFPVIAALLVRHLLIGFVVKDPPASQIKKQFVLDFSLFMTAALGLVLVNIIMFNAPWHSNGKVIVGLGILGLFVAVDLALSRELFLAKELVRQGKDIERSECYASLSQKLFLMATLVVISISLVLFLMINQDLIWLLAQEPGTTGSARNSIMLEIGFVMLILLAYCIRVIHSYVGNLNMYLDRENGVLNEVLLGNLNVRVPVTSPDEFGSMARGTNAMIESLQQHQAELRQTRDVSILALASLAETRDNETGAHILRTQRYVKALALNLKEHPDFKSELTEEVIELLFKSAPLHDIGKVGIPDAILLKPGKLTEDEFEVMKGHALLGAEALLVAELQLGSNSFLRIAREITSYHHEKWNGSGYPIGLKGEAIPLSARLMALADVYDALVCKRVYKPAFAHEKAKAIVLEGEGSHFDPRIVEAFLDCEAEFIAIAREFGGKG